MTMTMSRREMVAWSTCLALAVVAGPAGAQPTGSETVQIGADTWTVTSLAGADVFTRPDGTRIEMRPASLPCLKQVRAAEALRYDWLPRAYWPKLDTGAGIITLCLQRVDAAFVLAIRPPTGKVVGADLAAVLTELAEQVRPPTEVPGIGAIHPSLPVELVRAETLAVQLDGQVAALGVTVRAEGSCAYDHAMTLVTAGGQAAAGDFAVGYWPTTFTTGDVLHGCLDLREGYLSVLVSPGSVTAAVGDVLAEIRRAAHATHGAPITSATDPMLLPHTQQLVSAKDSGEPWKVVDGTRFKLPGADVLVSIAPFGRNPTYAVGVSEGPCAVGTATAPAEVAAGLFPAQLGAIWIDDSATKLRWRAWACLAHGGATATISVLGPVASAQPPASRDAATIGAIVARVARSYGLDIPVHVSTGTGTVTPPPLPWSPSPPTPRRARPTGSAAGYVGVISLAPGEGDRRTGALVGCNLRLARRGVGPVLTFDIELGYGASEWIGELRTGVGLAAGGLSVIAGVSAGSIGPAAALDFYGEVGASTMVGRTLVSVAAMHAVGVGGPDHERLELRALITGRDETGLYVGARAMLFGDDGETMMDTGSGVLITFGGGAATND